MLQMSRLFKEIKVLLGSPRNERGVQVLHLIEKAEVPTKFVKPNSLPRIHISGHAQMNPTNVRCVQ